MAKNVKTLENEVNVLDHMPYKEIIKNKVDLLELYSGAARPTALAKQHGLTSLQPFEKDDGYDLNVRQVLSEEMVHPGHQPVSTSFAAGWVSLHPLQHLQ